MGEIYGYINWKRLGPALFVQWVQDQYVWACGVQLDRSIVSQLSRHY